MACVDRPHPFPLVVVEEEEGHSRALLEGEEQTAFQEKEGEEEGVGRQRVADKDLEGRSSHQQQWGRREWLLPG